MEGEESIDDPIEKELIWGKDGQCTREEYLSLMGSGVQGNYITRLRHSIPLGNKQNYIGEKKDTYQ